MLPGDRLPADEEEDRSNPTEGGASVQPPEETLHARDPASRGNTSRTDLISTQPLPASREAAGPQSDPQEPTCPRCGLAAPDHRLLPVHRDLSRLQGSSLSVHSSTGSTGSGGRKKNRSRDSVASSHQPAATPSDACFHLLLACLWCRCSVVLLGLLEACSSCLHALCSSCSCCCRCLACARCCRAVREAPVEELNCHVHCHAVLFESCCEPTECLEFCLECCEICHRS